MRLDNGHFPCYPGFLLASGVVSFLHRVARQKYAWGDTAPVRCGLVGRASYFSFTTIDQGSKCLLNYPYKIIFCHCWLARKNNQRCDFDGPRCIYWVQKILVGEEFGLCAAIYSRPSPKTRKNTIVRFSVAKVLIILVPAKTFIEASTKQGLDDDEVRAATLAPRCSMLIVENSLLHIQPWQARDVQTKVSIGFTKVFLQHAHKLLLWLSPSLRLIKQEQKKSRERDGYRQRLKFSRYCPSCLSFL